MLSSRLPFNRPPFLGGSRPQPVLGFDFVQSPSLVAGRGGQTITFTRATSAWYFNSAGVLTDAGSGNPRFDYDPVTLAARGLLVEEARTNICIRSEEFDNAAWVKTDTTITANNITSPDGTTDADLLTEGVAGTATVVSTAFTITANGTIAVSCFLKRGNTDWVVVNFNSGANNLYKWFNLATGAIGSNSVTGTGVFFGGSGKVQTLPNGWYRCSFAGTVGSGLTTAVIITSSASADASFTRVNNATRYQFGAMVEDNNTFPTSYIKTTSAAVPRNIDSALINTLTPWYNQSEGTFVAQFDVSATTTDALGRVAFAVGDPAIAFGSAEAIYAGRSASLAASTYVIIDGGANQVGMAPGNLTIDVAAKIAMCYKLNDCAASVNGAAAVTDVVATMPTPTAMSIGSAINGWTSGLSGLNGHIRSLSYYPRSLKNQLQQLST